MPIKVLLVGAGRMGRNHLRVLRASPRFEVVGVVDPHFNEAHIASQAGEERFADTWNVDCVYDCAIIATPSTVRRDVFAKLNSVPILCEKPLALSYVDAAFLRDNVRSLVVGHVERFNPAVKKLKSYGRRSLGALRDVRMWRSGSPAPTAARDGDVVFDLAVHDADIARYLFGPLRLIRSTVEGHSAVLHLRTTNDAGISICVAWGGGPKERGMGATTDGGTINADYIAQDVWFDRRTERGLVDVVKDEPLRAELDAFATFVETGGEVVGDLCSAEDGAAAVKLCEQACEPERGFV